jgi:hypothetical protein
VKPINNHDEVIVATVLKGAISPIVTRLLAKYKGIAAARAKIQKDFTAIDVKDFSYRQPADYCETFLGFRRFFTLENATIKALYDLANDMPWEDNTLVTRSEQKGQQTVTQALKSALLGGAISIQNSNMRAASNHRIQSPGGQITKELERNIWELQPHGVRDFVVKPINIHDEVIVATVLKGAISPIVTKLLAKYKPLVPLIDMRWKDNLRTWADK